MPAGDIRYEPLLHPLHAILLAFPIAMFTGALACDITYLNTAEMQWSHFSAWLIAGALLFGAPTLVWGIALFQRRRDRRATIYLALVAVMWVAGLINAFHHGRDGWSSVGTTGLALSIVSAALAIAAGWIGHSASMRRRPA